MRVKRGNENNKERKGFRPSLGVKTRVHKYNSHWTREFTLFKKIIRFADTQRILPADRRPLLIKTISFVLGRPERGVGCT